MGLCCCLPCCPGDEDSACQKRRRMGYTGAAILASATTPALVDENGVRTLALPHHECLPWRLSSCKSITILGQVPEKPNRWVVNLMVGGMDQDYALHFNVRHDAGYVVRNAKQNGEWGPEEICADPPMPFRPGEDFELTIFCTDDVFHLAVDGRHIATFRARLPLNSVSTLYVDGTVRLYGVTYSEDVSVYPPRTAPALQALPDNGYCSRQPVLPCRFPEPLTEGAEVTVCGRVRMLPFAFAIDLLSGAQVYPAPDSILHFNPRFQVGDVDVMVLNSRASGQWGKEERPVPFPFRPGRSFVVRFVYREDTWLVHVDGVCLTTYQHRLPPSDVAAINIHGDAIIDSIQFEPSAADLIQL